MSRIYGKLEKENGFGGLGDDDKLDCRITVGGAKVPLEFVDVIVTRDNNDYTAIINVHGETDFMLCAVKDNDVVMIKSLIVELKSWLEDCDYEDILQILEELKGLDATLSSYLEDMLRMKE